AGVWATKEPPGLRLRGEHYHALSIPCPATNEGARDVAQPPRRVGSEVGAIESCLPAEPERATVGRPEGALSLSRAGQRLRRGPVHALDVDPGPAGSAPGHEGDQLAVRRQGEPS